MTVGETEAGSTIPENPEAVIDVEKGPVMVVGGVSDIVWPSASYASAITQRRKEHGLETS